MVKTLKKQQINDDLINILLILRYRSLKPTLSSLTFCTLKQIKKILSIPLTLIHKVQMLIKVYLYNNFSKENKNFLSITAFVLQNLSQSVQKGKLTQEQIDFITNQQTLIKQSGKTLKERCVQFHRQYPEQKISSSLLSKLYKKHFIKRKIIVKKKIINTGMNEKCKRMKDIFSLQQQINEQEMNGYRIMYLDEVMFTYSTQQVKEYSNKNQNIEILEKNIQSKTRAVVACVSEKFGIDYFQIFDRSVDITKFTNFLQNLKEKYINEKIALFLDNMRVHHSKMIKALCLKLDIKLIFNIPYSPEFNPIENVFSLIKNKYKREKISKVALNQNYDVDKLIRDSFNNISEQQVKSICQCGYQRLMEIQ